MSGNDVERKLGITVEATDHASGKLGAVKREVAGIDRAAMSSGSGFRGFVGGVERGASRMKASIGSAVSHAKKQFGNLASMGAGFLGFGGLLGIGAVIGKSIEEAAAFGANVNLVAKATGLASSTASAMVDTLDKWGISSDRLIPMLGKLEKNVGAIAAKKDGLKKFGKEFGLALTNNRGHLLDANQLLLKSADYFNSNATASQKAVVMSKLWGKNWQDMIPILSKGSAFIRQQEKDSIHLTKQQLDNITKYRNAQREFQDTLGDVEVKIGSNIMPLLTEGMKSAGAWLDAHGDDVATWFKDAGGAVRTIFGSVVDVVGGIKAAWDTVPGPLRDLIVKGIVADRTMKFVFGFSPVGAISSGIGGAVGKILGGGLFSRGASPANPVFVSAIGGGLGGGAGVLPGGKGGGIAGKVGGVLSVAAAATAIATAVETYFTVNAATSEQAGGIQSSNRAQIAGGASLADLKTSLSAIDGGIKDIRSNPLFVLVQGDALTKLDSMRNETVAAIGRATGTIHNADRWWSEAAANTGRTADRVESTRASLTQKADAQVAATAGMRDKLEGARIAIQNKKFTAKVTVTPGLTVLRVSGQTIASALTHYGSSGAAGKFNG